MRIDKLRLSNFRCFKEYEISFGKKSTILIGKNGTGKTNLLTSLVYAMSFPFAKNLVKGGHYIATSSSDLKVATIDSKDLNDARYDDVINDYQYPLEIQSEAVIDDKEISWSMLKDRKGGGLHSSKYKKAFNAFHSAYYSDLGNENLPLIVFFSDSYPHKKISIGTYPKAQLKKEGRLPRNFGYYMWDKETNCIDIWVDRYIKTYNTINNFKSPAVHIRKELIDLYREAKGEVSDTSKSSIQTKIDILEKKLKEIEEDIRGEDEFKEIRFIDDRLKKFSAPLRDEFDFLNSGFEIDKLSVTGTTRTEMRLQFGFKDDRKIFFDNLPQGYKRIFSIVFDIAYRSFILNSDQEPKGLVFIDELELHLHPTLQQEIMERLLKTFPEIQFVISTHSPIVISNYNADGECNKIMKLENKANEYSNSEVHNIYGINYETSLMEVMGSQYRSSKIDELIDSYVLLKTRKKDEAANSIWIKLFDIVGIGNSVIEAEIEKKIKANS